MVHFFFFLITEFACKINLCFQISPFQTESVDYSLPSYPFFDVPDISPSPTLEVSFSTTLKLPDTFLGSEEAKNGFEKSNTGGNSGTTTLSTSNSTSSSVDEPNATVFPFNEDRKSIPATVFPEISTDQKYLLLTVLKNESFLPEIHLNSTENKLSTLYKKAYHRFVFIAFFSSFGHKFIYSQVVTADKIQDFTKINLFWNDARTENCFLNVL